MIKGQVLRELFWDFHILRYWTPALATPIKIGQKNKPVQGGQLSRGPIFNKKGTKRGPFKSVMGTPSNKRGGDFHR